MIPKADFPKECELLNFKNARSNRDPPEIKISRGFAYIFPYLREFSSVFDVFGCFGKPMSRRNFYFWIYEKIFIFKKVRAQNFLCDIFHNSFFKNIF